MASMTEKKIGNRDDVATSDIFTQSEVEGSVYRDQKITRIIVCSMTKPTGPKSDLHFYHKKLEKDKEGKDRDVDAIYLLRLFKRQTEEGLRDLEVLQDVNYATFVGNLKEDNTLKEYDSFLFVFLTYLGKDDCGDSGARIHFGDIEVPLTDIQDMLKSIPAMFGKPKLLLVQADHYDLGVTRQIYPLAPREEERYKTVKIPTDADLLIMMSTVSREKTSKASLLVQAFGDMAAMNMGRARCDQEDFLTLTVAINARFKELSQQVACAGENVPLPVVTSTLRQLLYL